MYNMNSGSHASLGFWIRVSFFFLLIAAFQVVTLRLMYVVPIDDVVYPYLKQSHSHVAFLGWAYLGLSVLWMKVFLRASVFHLPKYKWTLSLMAVLIAGMSISFPIYGYKALSIGLLTGFLIVSVLFSVFFFKDYRRLDHHSLSS